MAEQLVTMIFNATGQVSVPVHEEAVLQMRSINFSGVVFAQNATPTGSISLISDNYVVQEFKLPADYKRVAHTPPRHKHFESREFIEEGPRKRHVKETKITNFIPALSGLQFYVGVALGYSEPATLEYFLEMYVDDGTGWVGLKKGVAVGAPAEGNELWFNVYFDPVGIEDSWLTNKFRMGIRGRNVTGAVVEETVNYSDDGASIVIDSTEIDISVLSPTPLEEGGTYPFELNGVPSLIFVQPGSGLLLYSVQQGVTQVWYSSPNPLKIQGVKAYLSDGITPFQQNGQDVSLNFRILAEVADDGTDFFGNVYRSTLVKQEPAKAIAPWSPANKFWLSKPNPSQFATESLYFDMRDDSGQAVVIDTIFLNPITPGIYFNVYYSIDDAPGTGLSTWDQLLWSHVPKVFQMTKQDMYYLPEPIIAKYVKVEFTHLQGHTYDPGLFQKPTLYREYPSWVQNYFTAGKTAVTHDPLVAPIVTTLYNTLQVIYPPPAPPPGPNRPTVQPRQWNLFTLISSLVNDDSADYTTLSQISIANFPFTRPLALMGEDDDMLTFWAHKCLREKRQSVEAITPAQANTAAVSSADRLTTLAEKVWPVMYFYLRCRHGYREMYGTFENGVAYYAGVQQIAFYREKYDQQSDTKLYVESVGDAKNILSSDFLLDPVDFRWVTYE